MNESIMCSLIYVHYVYTQDMTSEFVNKSFEIETHNAAEDVG